MALSYLATSVLVALLAVIVGRATGGSFPISTGYLSDAADQTAMESARTIAQGAEGLQLAPDRIPQLRYFVGPDDVDAVPITDGSRLVVPYIPRRRPTTEPVSAEMAVDLTGRVVATSYPSRFPLGVPLDDLVAGTGAQLAHVLAGDSARGDATVDGGRVLWVLRPVLHATGPASGAVYVQVGLSGTFLRYLVLSSLLSVLIAVVALAPVGALFGVLTTRGVASRIGALVDVSKALAAGEFASRVEPRGGDEVADLQRQFNAMADRLDEAVRNLQRLAADNGRREERGRIARELHETISQELFALRMMVGGLELAHAPDGIPRRQLAEIGRSLTVTIGSMRSLMLALQPPIAGGTSLPAALRELAASYRRRAGVPVATHVESVSLAAHVEDGLLRVAHEALANAVRHSGADRIEVGLRRTGGGVELRVADNGTGFDRAAAAARGGLGLRILEERAAELGGTLRIDSGTGTGTAVVLTVEDVEGGSHPGE